MKKTLIGLMCLIAAVTSFRFIAPAEAQSAAVRFKTMFVTGTMYVDSITSWAAATTMNFLSKQTNGNGTGFVFKVYNAFTGSNKWFEFQKNDGSSIFYCDGNGICRIGGALQVPFSEIATDQVRTYGGTLKVQGNQATGSGNVGIKFGPYSNAISGTDILMAAYKASAMTTPVWSMDAEGHQTFADTTTNASQIILPVNTRICFNSGCTVWIMGNTGADLNMTTIGRLLTNAVDLSDKDLTVYTCTSTYASSILANTLTGSSTGNKGTICACLSDGSGNYAYVNQRTGWRGTSSTCPTTESASASGSIDFGSISAGTCSENTLSLTGVVATDNVSCKWPTALETGLAATCKGGTDVITFRLCNVTGSPIDPASGTFGAFVPR